MDNMDEIISEDELNDLLEEATEVEKPVKKIEESSVAVNMSTEDIFEDLCVVPDIVDEKELFELDNEVKPVKTLNIEQRTELQNNQSMRLSEVVDISGKSLVAPVCSLEKAIEIFKLFEEAKTKILTNNDILWISENGRPSEQKGQGTAYIKRSGWRKLARFFGLSWNIESTEKIFSKDGSYLYKVRVKIWHPADVSIVSEGLASSKDVFFTKGGRVEAEEENVIMKAQTVAINRGISDILGCGEVAAEEL